MPAAAHPKGIPALAVALFKLMFVLLQPVEEVSVTAVAHSFCAKMFTNGMLRKKHNKKNSRIDFGYNDSFIVIVT